MSGKRLILALLGSTLVIGCTSLILPEKKTLSAVETVPMQSPVVESMALALERKRSLAEMQRTEDLVEKKEKAREFFAAFEFQLWQKNRTQKSYEALIEKNVKAFFTYWNFFEERYSGSLMVPGEVAALDDLYVLATSSHYVGRELLENYHLEKYTIYHLLRDSLLGLETVPEGVKKIVSQNRKSAEYLLQLRHNFYSLVAIDSVFQVKDYKQELRVLLGEWSPDFSRAHSRMSEILMEAIEAQVSLIEVDAPLLFAEMPALRFQKISLEQMMNSLRFDPQYSTQEAYQLARLFEVLRSNYLGTELSLESRKIWNQMAMNEAGAAYQIPIEDPKSPWWRSTVSFLFEQI